MGTQGHRTVDTREIEKTRCFHVFAFSKKSLRVVLAPCKCCVFFVEPVSKFFCSRLSLKRGREGTNQVTYHEECMNKCFEMQ